MQAFPRAALMAAFVALGLPVSGSVTKDHSAMAQSSAKPVTTSSGLQYIDSKAGTGASPRANQTAVVHYTGWLYVNGAKGKKFDSLGRPQRAVRVPGRRGPGDQRLGRGRGVDEGRRQAHADRAAAARLRRARSGRRHSAERDTDVRCGAARPEVKKAGASKARAGADSNRCSRRALRALRGPHAGAAVLARLAGPAARARRHRQLARARRRLVHRGDEHADLPLPVTRPLARTRPGKLTLPLLMSTGKL